MLSRYEQRRSRTPRGSGLPDEASRCPSPAERKLRTGSTTVAEGRKAVQELAAKKVDLVKIWVDDRDGMYKKLTPDLYGAIIDEAHKNGLRVTAHIFTLEDAKGLLRAGLDAFAHGVRDKDIDDEFLNMMKQRPAVVVVPNLPDRGVATDLSWLGESVPAAELKTLQATATDRPAVQQTFGIQSRNLAKLNAAGVRIALGTDGSVAWAHHLEMEDMAASGMTPAQVIVAATRNAADLLKVTDAGTHRRGQERRLHRSRRESSGRHQEHATYLRRLPARYGGGQSGDTGKDDGSCSTVKRNRDAQGQAFMARDGR